MMVSVSMKIRRGSVNNEELVVNETSQLGLARRGS